MKKHFLFCLLLLFSNLLIAQKNYKVVFDLTSRDTIDHKNVLRWINEISKVADSELEVVMYGKGLEMVTKDRSVVAKEIVALAAKKNVSFKVCEAAMKNNSISKEQLLPGVGIVPDGIYEIIMKQRDGWGYIKVSK